jgi:hypothetical protein
LAVTHQGDIILPPVPFPYSEDLARAKARALTILGEIEEKLGESEDITTLRDRIIDLSNYLAFIELNMMLYEFAIDHPEVRDEVYEIRRILGEAIL